MVDQEMVAVALSFTKFCDSERPQQPPPAQSPPCVEKSSLDQYVRPFPSAVRTSQNAGGWSLAHG